MSRKQLQHQITLEWVFTVGISLIFQNSSLWSIILLTSIFTFFFFGEIRNLTTLCLLNNNGFSLSSFFSSFCSLLWLGAQFPIEKFLSYGRIFTLHYYFLLMCILFLPLSFFLFKITWIIDGQLSFPFPFVHHQSLLHLMGLVFWISIHLEVFSLESFF